MFYGFLDTVFAVIFGGAVGTETYTGIVPQVISASSTAIDTILANGTITLLLGLAVGVGLLIAGIAFVKKVVSLIKSYTNRG